MDKINSRRLGIRRSTTRHLAYKRLLKRLQLPKSGRRKKSETKDCYYEYNMGELREGGAAEMMLLMALSLLCMFFVNFIDNDVFGDQPLKRIDVQLR